MEVELPKNYMTREEKNQYGFFFIIIIIINFRERGEKVLQVELDSGL